MIDKMKERILYAEDNEGISRQASKVMEREGYEVVAFGDGEEALKGYLKEIGGGRKINLVITDWKMPVVGGYLIRGLREQGYLGEIAIKTGEAGYTLECIERFAEKYGVFNVSSDPIDCLRAYEAKLEKERK